MESYQEAYAPAGQAQHMHDGGLPGVAPPYTQNYVHMPDNNGLPSLSAKLENYPRTRPQPRPAFKGPHAGIQPQPVYQCTDFQLPPIDPGLPVEQANPLRLPPLGNHHPTISQHHVSTGQVPQSAHMDGPALAAVESDPELVPVETLVRKGKRKATEPDARAPPTTKKTRPPKDLVAASAKAAGKDKSGSKGRQKGAGGYGKEDVDALLAIVEQRLPQGQMGWEWVMKDFNSWAEKNNANTRDVRGLRAKFDAIVKHRKPTGSATVPDYITKAWLISEAINERAGLLEVEDTARFQDSGDEDNVIDISSDKDLEEVREIPPPITSKTVAKGYCVNPPAPPPLGAKGRTRAAATSDALTSITSIFSPDAQARREDARFMNTFQMSQLSSIQQELRDTRARIDILHDRLNSETRRADRAESELAVLKVVMQGTGSRYGHGRQCSRSPADYGYRDRSPRHSRSSHHYESSRPTFEHRHSAQWRSPSPQYHQYHRPPSPPAARPWSPIAGPSSLAALASVAASLPYGDTTSSKENQPPASSGLLLTPSKAASGNIVLNLTPYTSDGILATNTGACL
ncbi:hypothetical protein OE88DRAFT_1726238 [Heliocybe sulcata]|uniref:DUF6818 domain-containing protein n=1 Tax=Heliocybe sulcata TaxID=5364 RepID=A0A5C3MZ37_9AGAM|nr:hypothetical protein OE88DRAFT_1726238 [Heliocybe sulcata]